MKRFFIFCLVVGFVFPLAGLASSQSADILSNSIGMKFVLIPAGTFQMGSPPGDRDRDIAEQLQREPPPKPHFRGPPKPYEGDYPPQVQVTISKPFYLQTTEVTQGQWQKVMGDNPSQFKECGKDCPVEKVSWHEAQAFIKKLNQMENTGKYRLPTEAEWEYACRAGSTTRYCFGDDDTMLKEYAWYGERGATTVGDGVRYLGTTHPVGRLKPNAWGLYDMHGNIWEWCQDWFGEYTAGPVTDYKGPSFGEKRVSRSGAWDDTSRRTRSYFRWGFPPRIGMLLSAFELPGIIS